MAKTQGYRKFSLAFVTMLIASFLCWNGDLSDASYEHIIIGVVAVYVAGNVYQKKLTGGVDGG